MERTRKMGVNALRFRAHQHEAFFLADADGVGITEAIPWEFNQRWLELVAASGTPLFVSAQAGTLSGPQRAALRDAFTRASRPQPLAEPLDWMLASCPARWNCGSKILEWDWFNETAPAEAGEPVGAWREKSPAAPKELAPAEKGTADCDAIKPLPSGRLRKKISEAALCLGIYPENSEAIRVAL
jgi:hypothetical protein